MYKKCATSAREMSFRYHWEESSSPESYPNSFCRPLLSLRAEWVAKGCIEDEDDEEEGGRERPFARRGRPSATSLSWRASLAQYWIPLFETKDGGSRSVASQPP